jgi:di/tricarboxylate transporter
MIIWGILLIPAAALLIKYLQKPVHGFTYRNPVMADKELKQMEDFLLERVFDKQVL